MMATAHIMRSEEHTSELQSRQYLVCRLLLEKKNDDLHGRSQSHAAAQRRGTRARYGGFRGPPSHLLRAGLKVRCDGPQLFFFNDPATTEIYTLSLHDALPIFADARALATVYGELTREEVNRAAVRYTSSRSEEHTSELQSRQYLVCRLLL